MTIEPLERARCGDRDAFAMLVNQWGEPSMKIALPLLRDRARAETAVRDAFVRAWSDLPSLHGERALRPWLFARVVDAALGLEPAGGEARALDGLAPESRALAVLKFGVGLGPTELALSRPERSAPTTFRDARATERSLQAAYGSTDAIRRALAEHSTGADLPATFFAQAIAPRLGDPELFVLKRSLRTAGAVDLAGVEIDDTTSAIGGRFGRHDDAVVIQGRSMLAWLERVKLPLIPSVELRWSLGTADHGVLLLRLRGVALPPGPAERVLRALVDRRKDRIREAARARLEHAAAGIEARAQRR